MGGLLANLVFLEPWILAGLAALPVLYFLLRITPPAPKLIRLPTARFLEGLRPDSQTPSKTPWWILLLRLLAAALVIIALARPVYNPAATLPGSGAVRLVIDNGWAAAAIHDRQSQAATEIIEQAGREKRELFIQSTAAAPGTTAPAAFGPLSSAEALSILKGLKPYPWSADYGALAKQLGGDAPERELYSIWLSHGLDENGFAALTKALGAQGGLSVIMPEPTQLPLLLKPAKQQGRDIRIALDAPDNIEPGLPVSVQILGQNGTLLDQKSVTLDPANLPAEIQFDIPETLQGDIGRFQLAGQRSAGGVYLLDESLKRRSVGIAGPEGGEEAKPFIEARYYLTRALEPYTELHTGSVEHLLEQESSVIILPDIAALPAATLNALEDWVKDGGLLLRFAGPNMTGVNTAQMRNILSPVPLRASQRSTQGTLSWEASPKLAPFTQDSPFYGITLYDDITVRQQILPDPTGNAPDAQVWAALDDGTPLITAAPLDKGLLVMVHTTASPDWSDLALSGTYVEILRRLVAISGMSRAETQNTQGALQPIWVLDGFGARQSPDSTTRPIPAPAFAATPPGPDHPPGLYGRGGVQAVLNLGDHLPDLKPVPSSLPPGVTQSVYGGHYEHNLTPYFLFGALALLLADWLIMIAITSGLTSRLPRFAAVTLLLCCLYNASPAYASDQDYADGLYLAYIKTGNPIIDSTSQKGLESLAVALNRRTSAEVVGVAGLNPESDTLAFFPLIYWPVKDTPQDLSAKALQNVQSYLDHGGTILFDTRDQNLSLDLRGQSQNVENLKNMIGALNIPPLKPIDKDHVLTRTFYLLDEFPGLYNGGTLWVEQTGQTDSVEGQPNTARHDGVSSVIIGGNDWASAWAAQGSTRSALGGGIRQQEMAYRTGVNFMLYALTGNYKADQVHVPYILERLGR